MARLENGVVETCHGTSGKWGRKKCNPFDFTIVQFYFSEDSDEKTFVARADNQRFDHRLQ
ncbi:hypothetical protein [Coleofasciculus chthonoplastes]|uniref:hypothetical protein n=1 Tax=Coleofasciculus chthonoplastes TaxID=64178 RepID=UPI0032FDB9F1